MGLPVALAFLSAWTKKPLAEGVAATGFITRGGAVLTVGQVALKAQAVAARTTNARFFVATHDVSAVEQAQARVEPVGVRDLAEAAHVLGLELENGDYRPWLGDVSERVDALDAMSRHVQKQDLSEYGSEATDSRGWLSLADRMALLLDSLGEVALDATVADRRVPTCCEARDRPPHSSACFRASRRSAD